MLFFFPLWDLLVISRRTALAGCGVEDANYGHREGRNSVTQRSCSWRKRAQRQGVPEELDCSKSINRAISKWGYKLITRLEATGVNYCSSTTYNTDFNKTQSVEITTYICVGIYFINWLIILLGVRLLL